MAKFISFANLSRFKSYLDIAFNAVSEALAGKQDALVSGQNIKTINNQSVLGSGNIEVGGGSNLPLSIVDGKLCITFNE